MRRGAKDERSTAFVRRSAFLQVAFFFVFPKFLGTQIVFVLTLCKLQRCFASSCGALLCTSVTAMWLASLCAIVLSFARVIVGQNSDNLFIVPTAPGPSDSFIADLSWTLGSIQNIQWTTTLDSYEIDLFQQSIDPASGTQLQTIYST